MSTQEGFKTWLGRYVMLPTGLLLVLANIGIYSWSRSLYPLSSVLGLVGGSLILSLVLLLIIGRSARQGAEELFFRRFRTAAEAGNWAMRRVLGRPVIEDEPDEESGEARQVIAELEHRWQGYQQELQELLTPQSEEVRRDLDMAKDFQMAYLNRPYPKIPAVHVQGRLRLEFYHRYEPAMALGGDFFDILSLPQGAAGVFIADVMGHGTRSALITAIVRTLLTELNPHARNPAHFIHSLNNQISRFFRILPQPLFASAFYFVVDTTARHATFTSAGHPAPFHLRRNIGRVDRLEVPEPHGAALGLIENEEYGGGSCRLIPGDVFIFFTDGVYEARNPGGEEFGLQRMASVIGNHLYQPGSEIVDIMIDAVNEFVEGEPMADDICLVAVEVTTDEASRDSQPGA